MQPYPTTMSRDERRARGAYYTPDAMVRYVVAEALAGPLASATWDADGAPRLRVLDPACGDGRFLVAAVDAMCAASPRGAEARGAVVERCVTGVERDAAAATVARAALGPGADVRVGEALLSGVVDEGMWDAVVGNPPYVRSVAMRATDPTLWAALRGRFAATSFREWDLYGAFIEQSLRWVRGGGEVGLVVPSRWFTAQFASGLREVAAPALRMVVDFAGGQVFEGATTYAALVFLRGTRCVDGSREAGASEKSRPSPGGAGGGWELSCGSDIAAGDDVAIWRYVGDPHATPHLPPNAGWRRGHVPRASLTASPWTLEIGDAAVRLTRLRAAGPRLGDVARIAKGAGTNADPVFLLDDATAATVEPDALTPCARGRDIRAFAVTPRRHALLPYDRDGRLIPWRRYAERFPRAAAHLERHRALLEARERGRFRGDDFHRWGRPQNIAWHLDHAAKLLVPDATSTGRAALDDRGTLAIDTAYAIRATVPLGLVLAALNSDIVGEWLRSTGIPLRGGYFRMKTAYLTSLPLPDPTTPAALDIAARAVAGDPETARDVLDLY